MSADKIEITYAEFENDLPSVKRVPACELYYAEWRRNDGEIESAHAKATGAA